MRRAAKVDDNQSQIVDDLRAAGFRVRSTAMVSDGFPDIIVGAYHLNFLFEVKDPKKIPSKRELSGNQKDFHETWAGQVDKIETAEEAVSIIIDQARRAGKV